VERLILAILAAAWPEAMTSTQIADALLDRGDQARASSGEVSEAERRASAEVQP